MNLRYVLPILTHFPQPVEAVSEVVPLNRQLSPLRSLLTLVIHTSRLIPCRTVLTIVTMFVSIDPLALELNSCSDVQKAGI